MFDVELQYLTKIGNLNKIVLTTSQRVATRAEAEELRDALRALPGLAGAAIRIKNAPPPPTVDEAMDGFIAEMRRFPARDAR
jgi:hypothetical protein